MRLKKVNPSILVTCVALLFGTSPVSSQEAITNPIHGEILEFGTYKVLERKEDASASSQSGAQVPIHISPAIEFLNRTNVIFASKGISFGFRYKLANLPNHPIALTIKTQHPEFAMPDGTKDSGREMRILCEPIDGAWTNHIGFRFDENFEMVGGNWEFSLFCGNEKLLSQTFHVEVKPATIK